MTTMTRFVTTGLFLAFALSAMPASAIQLDPAGIDAVGLYCKDNPGYVAGQEVCPDNKDGETCEETNVFILTNDQCKPEEGEGCDGTNIFIMSDDNCEGGPGEEGCEGTNIIDPTSDDNCQGGPGALLRLLLDQVR